MIMMPAMITMAVSGDIIMAIWIKSIISNGDYDKNDLHDNNDMIIKESNYCSNYNDNQNNNNET